MVFESVVVNLLNRHLGDYFENLDTSQLKLGIWGGDVVLKELVLRNSVLDELNVPFKIVVGKVGSLTVNIPWSNLYTAPVKLVLKDLLLLVAPSKSVKYDAAAEQKAANYAKKKEIEIDDEVRKIERAKKAGEIQSEANDSFIERLGTQIIKNVKIKIETIHIRYEDNITKQNGNPFSFGITLKGLYVKTDGRNVEDAESELTFHKLAILDSLSFYWNSQSDLVQSGDQSPIQMMYVLEKLVTSDDSKTHVFGPINSTAKLVLTPNPEKGSLPFSKPKFKIDVDMEEFGLGMTNLQFQDIIELAENIGFMTRAHLHRKFRPQIIKYHGHSRDWWKYAYKCIVEEDIRRRQENWDWDHIKRHRNMCRTYANVYYQKITESKLRPEIIIILNKCERELDMHNIILIRDQIDAKVEEESKYKKARTNGGGGGWFSGWFSSGATSKSTEDLTVNRIIEMAKEALPEEEKMQLYSSEDEIDSVLKSRYPEHYDEYQFNFNLSKLTATIKEITSRDVDGKSILDLKINNVGAKMTTRPVKNGVKVSMSLGDLLATGYGNELSVPPSIIASKLTDDFGSKLFKLEYEANPLNCSVDHRVVVRGKAVEVVYDIKTISKLIDCFKLPQSATTVKSQLLETAEEWKQQSAAGLLFMLDTRAEVEVDVHLEAPYFLIPQDGVMNPNTTVLVTDFGELRFKSKPREKNWDKEKISKFRTDFDTEEEFQKALVKLNFDSYLIELTDFQVLLTTSSQDYYAAKTRDKAQAGSEAKFELPKPLLSVKTFDITMEHSKLSDDLTIPRVQFKAHLPLLDADVSESNFLKLWKLLVTLPLPEDEKLEMPENSFGSIESSYSQYISEDVSAEAKEVNFTELVDMLIKLTVDAVSVKITRTHREAEVPIINADLKQLVLVFQSKSYTEGKSSKGSLLQLDAKMESLIIELSREDKDLIQAILSSMNFSLTRKTGTTFFTFQLKNLQAMNMDPNALYRNVVSVEDDKVVVINVTMYDQDKRTSNVDDMDQHDISVRIETGSPKVIYFRSFINEILNFITTFGATREGMYDAIATAAKENLTQAMSPSIRVSLQISVKAPVVIIPRNEHSPHALLADMGYLTLTNKFTKNIIDSSGNFVMIDNIEINLKEIKVSRAYLNGGQEVQSQVLILEPVMCKVQVGRNMGSEWCHSVPSYDAKVLIQTATARMSNEDYNLALGCIMENILVSAQNTVVNTTFIVGNNKPEEKALVTSLSEDMNSLVSEAAGTYVDIRSYLWISQLKFVMYQNHVFKLEEQQGNIIRDDDNRITSASIKNIDLNAENFSDQSITCEIKVEDASFKDKRPGGKGIIDLIQRKLDKDLLMFDPEPLATLNYKSSPKDGTTVKIKTSSLELVFELDFLLQIYDFIKITEPLGRPFMANNLDATDNMSLINQQLSLEENSSAQTFIGLYNFSSTNIILVETMKNLDTRALILNCGAVFQQVTADGNEKLTGTITNLKLSSCVYDPKLRENSEAQVISPMSVTFGLNNSEMNVVLSNILVRVTAGTLELLTKIYSSIDDPSKKKNEFDSKGYSNIWDTKEVASQNFWFLQEPEIAGDVSSFAEKPALKRYSVRVKEAKKANEKVKLTTEQIVVIFETGSGNTTMPLVLVEGNLDLQALDWSKHMKVTGGMTLEAAYYNAKFGLWEHLIEPVGGGRKRYNPWKMVFDYKVEPNRSSQNLAQNGISNQNIVSASLQSNDTMEVTVTKTALNAINILKDDFTSAVKQLASDRKTPTAQFKVKNHTGMDVRLYLKDKTGQGYYYKLQNDIECDTFILKHGDNVHLNPVINHDWRKQNMSTLQIFNRMADRLLTIEIPDLEFKKSIPINLASQRYFWAKRNGLICDISTKECSKVLTLRGILQIKNDLEIPVDVWYTGDGIREKHAGTALPNKSFDFPLECTYGNSCQLSFAPEGHSVTSPAFKWDDVYNSSKVTRYLSASSWETGNNFYIRVVGTANHALSQSSNTASTASKHCVIYLKPPVILNNLLPVSLYYCGDRGKDVVKIAKRGTLIQLTDLSVGRDDSYQFYLQVPNYNNQSWKSGISINKYTQDMSAWKFVSEQNSEDVLTLGIHREINNEQVVFHVYSPFWMINRTGLDLAYKIEGSHNLALPHLREQDIPLMFSFPGRAFFGKKFAHVKVNDGNKRSDWSDKFSLDAAGSEGFVMCKSPGQDFQIGVEIQLSSYGLTRFVIFTPRFYLSNQCPFTVYVSEMEKFSDTIVVGTGKCLPFWPKSQRQCLLRAAVDDSKRLTETKPFSYDTVNHTLLQMSNEYGGLHVDISITESKTTIVFDKFVPGQAPAYLINMCENMIIEVNEQDSQDNSFYLLPKHCQYFTWRNPTGSRKLEWCPASGGESNIDELLKDGYGTFSIYGDAEAYHWISFLDGLQRCLLFTQNPSLIQILKASEGEVPISEYNLNLNGIGLSLVDNENLKEVMYMRLASSAVTWEQKHLDKLARFRPLSGRDSKDIEGAYQNYIAQQSKSKSLIQFDSGLVVDFRHMSVRKPIEATIRRSFQPGVWLNYKALPHSTLIHAKLNRVQIDNQLLDCIFPVVLAPVKPPKSVVQNEDLLNKPFVEISIMQANSTHSKVVQYKYFTVLVQEFLLKVDIKFIGALVEFFVGNQIPLDELKKKYIKEYDEVRLPFDDFLRKQTVSSGRKHFYDFLHFSPLKIHFSFSMQGFKNMPANPLLKIIVGSFGSLTEIQDSILKMNCFEIHHSFLSYDQLQNELISHYKAQALKQLYVLVFGLDVIGNPFGLAVGMMKGIESFFYEPIHGAIQGPEEFGKGIALGVKSLLGGTVGGTAGAFSKITGTLGKGIAALTMDEDYKTKRQETLRNRGNAAEGFARSGRGLFMGVVEGVTGVVSKPLEGGKKDGASGFFKGVAKGALGLVARPAGGIVDFASESLKSVQVVTSDVEEIRRIRSPRSVPANTILQPFGSDELDS